jgi:multiple sugar transport system substrate-binding protein
MANGGGLLVPALTRRALLARAQGAAALPGLASLAGSALLAACMAGGSSGAAAPESATKQRQPATIRFAAAGVGTELEIWTEVTNAYNALGTGITVQYEPCTAGSASAQDCLPVYFSEYVAGSAPDVWRVDDEPLPFYADKGIYLELDAYFTRDSKELNPSDFFPRSIAAFRYDRQAMRHGQGKLYALPFNTGGDMLFFNKQLFNEANVPLPPLDGSWTIDEWLERARKLSVLEGGGPLLKTVALSGRPSFRGNLDFLWARGASFLDSTGRRWTFNTPEMIKAYEWFVDLRRRYKVVPGPDDFKGQGNVFYAGRAAMSLNYPNNLRELYARPQLDWDVTHFPKAIDGKRYTRETADGTGLPTGGKQPEPAWTFVKWLASIAGARIFTRAGRAVPARRSAALSADYVRPDTPQHEENIVQALEYSRLQPITLMFNDAEQIIRAYENAMFDEKEPLPVPAALAQLQEVLDKLERDRQKPASWEPRR